jgi:rRNA maturation endonuclease Nob1
MINRLINRTYQEKQVDTTVVALLVKAAIRKRNDTFAIIAGDVDILPAIKIACPEFTRNLLLVTTHPDEIQEAHRQSSYTLAQFNFDIAPLYLQQHVIDLIDGPNTYTCAECGKIFTTLNPIHGLKQTFCKICRP